MGNKGIKQLVGIAAVSLAVAACGSAPATNDAGGAPTSASDGHGHSASPPPPPAPLRDGERFQEISLDRPYQPAPPEGSTDEYRCFLIDPALTEAAFLTGSQFLPQNTEIVHHAILYRVAPDEVAKAKSVDAKTEGDGWQCFGGSGLSAGSGGGAGGDKWIGAWAPGNNETLIGDLTGYPVEPGTQIVLQVHYNLLATNGKPGPTDQSSMRLRLAPGTADVTPLHTMLVTAPIELPCTPSESGPLCDRATAIDDLVKRTGIQARHIVEGLNVWCNKGREPVPGPTQHCDLPVSKPALLYAIAPHMHLLGRSISVELNPGTPSAHKLLDQPTFNFDNQASQPLPQPVRLNAGDKLRITCTHDATQRSQLPALKQLKPRYVVWGDGTSDEMCLAMLATTNKV